MLIDNFLSQHQHQAAAQMELESALAKIFGEDLGTAFRRSQVFVLSPLTVATITDLAADPGMVEKIRDYIFAPAVSTWLEFAGDPDGFYPLSHRHAFFVNGDGGEGHAAIVAGSTSYITDIRGVKGMDHISIPFVHDFPAEDRPILSADDDLTMTAIHYAPWSDIWRQIDLQKMGAFLGIAFALIASPHVTTLARADLGKINKHRTAKQRPPLITYEMVNINLDDAVRNTPNLPSQTGTMALHHVRAHLRVRLGKVEMVRPHWRGDPTRGRIIRRHIVRREEDEPGTWQGGPMPPNTLMR